jgi:hypothetical protein
MRNLVVFYQLYTIAVRAKKLKLPRGGLIYYVPVKSGASELETVFRPTSIYVVYLQHTPVSNAAMNTDTPKSGLSGQTESPQPMTVVY